jgi:hypothetical protein
MIELGVAIYILSYAYYTVVTTYEEYFQGTKSSGQLYLSDRQTDIQCFPEQLQLFNIESNQDFSQNKKVSTKQKPVFAPRKKRGMS